MAIDLSKWQVKANRFVAFFDIMGFKDIVERNVHKDVISKLRLLKSALGTLEKAGENEKFSSRHCLSETKSITFSDSIIIFSKGDTADDACKIILDCGFLVQKALKYGIAMKGAISYGEITADFENSLFFGRPIIDAYELHNILQLYSVVLDNTCEAKLDSLKLSEPFFSRIVSYKANFKTGKITHRLIRPDSDECLKKQLLYLQKLYKTVSGSPRIYIDNTLDYLQSISFKE